MVKQSILALAISFLLVACSTSLSEQQRHQAEVKGALSGAMIGGVADGGAPLGIAVGSIVGAAVGQYGYAKHVEQLQAMLAQIGGQLIVIGDKVRIVLPTDSLFINSSAKLSYGAENYLAIVLSYLRQFGALCITITGYTDAMPNKKANKALALQRAQKLAGFFWAGGLAEQYLKVQGLGQAEAIASNRTADGKAYNRRIEITFWQGVN